jgi:hypothetical protein
MDSGQRDAITTVRLSYASRRCTSRAMTEESDSATSKRADQKRKAAARARSYRARLRADRSPTSRDVDAALSEALAFHVSAARRRGAGVNIELAPMMTTARIVLEREGFRRKRAAKAISDRMTDRPDHYDPHHIPTHCPGAAERIRPTKAGDWKTPMSEILDHLAGV